MDIILERFVFAVLATLFCTIVINPKILDFNREQQVSAAVVLIGTGSAKVDVTNFGMSGINLHEAFRNAWTEGKIVFSSESGVFNPFSPRDKLYLPIVIANGEIVRQPIIKFEGLRYTFKKEYYLGNTALLPNSREIPNFQTKVSKRIFTEKDLGHFDTQRFRRYQTREQMPEQGSTLHFLMEPNPVSSNSTGEVRIKYRTDGRT